jgi:hypothetical protein
MDQMQRTREGQAMDTAYMEQANGQWEAWTYSDGQRIPLKAGERYAVQTWLYDRHYRVVFVK